MAKEKSQQVPVVSFENSLKELEEIVSRLESGSLPLEDALNEFERGIQIAKQGQKSCNRLSNACKSCLAMMKIKLLMIFHQIPNKLCPNNTLIASRYSNNKRMSELTSIY